MQCKICLDIVTKSMPWHAETIKTIKVQPILNSSQVAYGKPQIKVLLSIAMPLKGGGKGRLLRK